VSSQSFQARGPYLSDASLVGEGALYCDDHVPVSEGLVTDDGHERHEHEYNKADGHTCTHRGEEYWKHEHAAVPASSVMWNGSTAWTKWANCSLAIVADHEA
jgi:hypothetical protein